MERAVLTGAFAVSQVSKPQFLAFCHFIAVTDFLFCFIFLNLTLKSPHFKLSTSHIRTYKSYKNIQGSLETGSHAVSIHCQSMGYGLKQAFPSASSGACVPTLL